MPHLGDGSIRRLLIPVSSDSRSTLLHLLSCPPCRKLAVGELTGFKETGKAPAEAVFKKDGLSWLWERVAEIERQWAAEIDKDLTAAQALFEELTALSDPGAALQEARFHSPALAGLLLAASEREGSPPARASFAALALEIAERIDLQSFPARLVVGLKVRAGCALAEAERLRSDLEAARKALDRVAAVVAALPLDAAERGLYCQTLALYRKAQGQIEEALALLGRAAGIFEDLELFQELGGARLEEGWLRLEVGEAETAEPALTQALSVLDPEQDPIKALRASFGLAFCLAEQGKTAEARRRAREARRFLSRLPGRIREQAGAWEEGLTYRLGLRQREIDELRSDLENLPAKGLDHEAAIIALNLLHLQQTAERGSLDRFCRSFDPGQLCRLPVRSVMIFSIAISITALEALEEEDPTRSGRLVQALRYRPPGLPVFPATSPERGLSQSEDQETLS